MVQGRSWAKMDAVGGDFDDEPLRTPKAKKPIRGEQAIEQ